MYRKTFVTIAKQISLALILLFVYPGTGLTKSKETDKPLQVVTTTTDYAFIASFVGGNRVDVSSIAKGDEDVHFVRPKPSFAAMLNKADLLISTGMDLELWLPGLIDKASNPKIREGSEGYVAASDGIRKLEIPDSPDRGEGGVHIYGNPHIQTSPVNMITVAENITIGLIKVDPDGKDYYTNRLQLFRKEMFNRLFGERLVEMVGGPTLCRLAENGRLIPFLQEHKLHGTPMIENLGGWMKKAMVFRGKKIVTYHKNWVYFARLFGLDVVGEVEPKPAIPPSPKDVEELINTMNTLDVPVVLAANYFDETKIRRITDAVKATPVIVPLSTGGAPGVDTYFDLVDLWIDKLLDAFGEKS